MAQLDPSIILQSRRPKLPDAGEMMQLRDLAQQAEARDLQLEDAKRGRSSRQTLADLYKQALRPDGSVDHNAILSGMAAAGYGEQIPDLTKQQSEARKAALSQEGEQVKLQKQKMDIVNQSMGSLLTNPNVSHQDVIGMFSSLVDRGVITQQQGAQMVQQLPGPGALRQFLVQKASEGLEVSKQLEMVMPKYDEQNRGGTISEGTIDPMTGVRTERREIRRTISPDAAAQAAAMSANPQISYQVDAATGQLVALPTRAPAGAPVQGQAALGPDGKPLTSKGNVTEDQAKAAGWLAQATNAYNNMQRAMTDQPGADQPGAAEVVAAIPSMGVGEAVGNMMRSPARQRFVQASSSLSEALLRAATGAGVNAQEARQKINELTPVWGDSAEQRKQKLDAIPIYLESLRARAGSAGRYVPPYQRPGALDANPAGGAAPRVMSDADYNALPSGTQFIAPDGSRRVKP